MHDAEVTALCSPSRRAVDSKASRPCQCSEVGEAKGTAVRDESVVAEVDVDAVDNLRLFCGLRVIGVDDGVTVIVVGSKRESTENKEMHASIYDCVMI